MVFLLKSWMQMYSYRIKKSFAKHLHEDCLEVEVCPVALIHSSLSSLVLFHLQLPLHSFRCERSKCCLLTRA